MSKRQGKPVRIRASRLNSGGDCLVLLPVGFRDALLDLSGRMKWSRVWTDDEWNSISLTESQASIVELGIQRLVDCVDINVINNVSCGGCGCSGDGTDVTVIIEDDEETGGFTEDSLPDDVQGELDPEGDVPQTLQDSGIGSWTDYDVYMCDVAWFVAEVIPRFLRIVELMSDKLSTILVVASALATVFPGAWMLKAGVVALVDLLAAITDVLIFELAFDNLVEMAEYIEEPQRQQEIACAIYENRYYLPAARNAVLVKIQQYLLELAFDGTAQEKLTALVDKVLPLRWYYKQIIEDALRPIERGRDCSGCDQSGGPVYDWTNTDGMNGNDPAPWSLGINAVLHQSPFYDGDGHMALRTAGNNISSMTVTNTDWCNAFFISNPTQKVMKEIRVLAALTDQHGAQPPSGSLEIVLMPGTLQEASFVFGSLPINDYQEYVVTQDFDWNVGDDAPVVTIRQVASAVFQAELKIGAVTMSLNNA